MPGTRVAVCAFAALGQPRALDFISFVDFYGCDTMTSVFFKCDVCHSNILTGFVPHYGLGLGIQSFLNCGVQSVCS